MTTAGHGGLYANGGFGGNDQGNAPRGFSAGELARLVNDKAPPHSLESEMALLGAMILDPQVITDVVMTLGTTGGPDMFYDPAHGAIYRALVDLFDRHDAGDLVQLVEVLRDREELKDVGGPSYLEKLVSETPGSTGAVQWARVVSDKATLRRLIGAGAQIIWEAQHTGHADEHGLKEVLDRAEGLVLEVGGEERQGSADRLADLLEQEYERALEIRGTGISGLMTGFGDLDDMLSGVQAGDMIIVAARPSMGKTALALNLAQQVALGGAAPGEHPQNDPAPVVVFSLEMSRNAVAQRMLSAQSGVSSHKVRTGQIDDMDVDKLLQACDVLGESPVFVDDTPSLTVTGMRTRARRLHKRHGIKMIVVDYLQLMTAPGAGRESRQVEVAAISRGIKALARELNVPIICLSQLNRGPESRSDNKPRMSDLRESGSIEQDADVVALLHREEYYHVGDDDWMLENEDKIGVAELIIAKQRNGPTGVVKLKWDASTTRFKNLATHGGWDAGGGGGGGGGGWNPAPMGGPDEASPFKVEVQTFSPGKKTGPVSDFRDGGGPDVDFDDDLPV